MQTNLGAIVQKTGDNFYALTEQPEDLVFDPQG
jgi:hypothetical protein